MVRNSENPRRREISSSSPGVQGEILVPDLTLTANFKMAAKRTHEVSYLYSVVKIFFGFQNSLCYFRFYAAFKIEAAWSRITKRALADGVFEPFDWGWGIHWYYKRIQGPVVRRPICAKPGIKFNRGFIFLCSKEFSRIIFSVIFSGSNHQLVDKKN